MPKNFVLEICEKFLLYQLEFPSKVMYKMCKIIADVISVMKLW